MWKLDKKEVNLPRARKATVYSMSVDPSEWPSTPTELHAAAKRAFAAAVSDFTHGQVAEVPPHVSIAVVRTMRPSMAPRVSVPLSSMDAAQYRWMYVVEAIESQCTFCCVGGVGTDVAKSKAIAKQGQASIHRSALDSTGFYDASILERETSLPGVPSGLSSPHDSVLSLSTSGGMSAGESHPLHDYAGVIPPVGMKVLQAHVRAHAQLKTLMWDRYQDQENVARFVRVHNVTPAYAVTHQGAATQVHEASTIGTVEVVGFPENARLQHAAHMVAHWLFREHVFPELEKGSALYNWVVEQETRLVTLHARFAYADDESIVAFLAPILSHYNLQPVSASAAPPELASLEDPAVSTSHIWYTLSAVDALLLDLPILQDGAHKVYVDPATHKMYLSVMHIADDLLPMYIESCIRGEVAFPRCTPSGEDTLLLDAEDARDVQQTTDEEVLKGIATAIVAARTERMTGASADLHLPRKGVQQNSLFHLENVSAPRNLMPLCKQRLRRKLVEEGHLKFGERFTYASYLLDLGYAPERIVNHIKMHFTTTGGTPIDTFETKYSSLVTRKETGLWVDDVRTRGYDFSCGRLIEGKDLIGDVAPKDATMCIGCPFARLDSAAIRQELQKAGNIPTADIEDIVQTATVGSNPAGACAKHYLSLYKGAPHHSWKPRAPRAFSQEAMTRVRRHVSLAP